MNEKYSNNSSIITKKLNLKKNLLYSPESLLENSKKQEEIMKKMKKRKKKKEINKKEKGDNMVIRIPKISEDNKISISQIQTTKKYKEFQGL